ncbi:MAG TPA: hypothetical protein VF628_09885 [Allosphingosinicella sp.]|jgi:hypothetical protein
MLRFTGTVAMALALGSSCGSSTSARRGQVSTSSIAVKHGELIDAVDQLSTSPAGSLQLANVATVLRVELIRADHTGFGIKYVPKVGKRDFDVDVFVLPDGEIRLTFTRVANQSIDDWRTQLHAKRWTANTPILHPFMMDSFERSGKQIRLEHNSTNVLTITVFGLNSSEGE